MAYEWTEAMATGDEAIDNEHRTLIAWINRLGEANEADRGEQEVLRVLNFLLTYARLHFAHEEGCFARARCPHAAANCKAHEQFIQHVTSVKSECEAHGVTEHRALELHRMLGEWLANHILKVDTSLKPCLESTN